MELTGQQSKAIKTIKRLFQEENRSVVYLAGFAGSGKSTILPFIIESLDIDPFDVAFMAPTGKAAKVMRNKLRDQGVGNIHTSTIHSAIYISSGDDAAALEKQLDYMKRRLKTARDDIKASLVKQISIFEKELECIYKGIKTELTFHINPAAPIKDKKLIVVDEGSMVGKLLAEDLKSFDIPILVMGDPGQLPPIKEDYGLTEGEPDIFLTEIHRQAKDNPIIFISTLARQGKDIPYGKYGSEVIVMPYSKYTVKMFDADKSAPQFIVGANKTRWTATKTLRNHYLGAGTALLGPRINEPLVVCKNSREHPNLVNGSYVYASHDVNLFKGSASFELDFIDEDSYKYSGPVFQGKFEEHFAGKLNSFTCTEKEAYKARKNSFEMDWAWAITTHKSQGSQWDDVVVIDESRIFNEQARNHLYTSITRAAKSLVLVR